MGGGDLISMAPGSLIGRDDDLEYITAFSIKRLGLVARCCCRERQASVRPCCWTRRQRTPRLRAVGYLGLPVRNLKVRSASLALTSCFARCWAAPGVERDLSQGVGRCAGCA